MKNSVGKGNICRSIAGHDCGKLYIVTEVMGSDRIALADGLSRKVSGPKIKNIKHITVLDRNNNLSGCYPDHIRDEDIRFVLNRFARNNSDQGE